VRWVVGQGLGICGSREVEFREKRNVCERCEE
jgi:hypothetical protein